MRAPAHPAAVHVPVPCWAGPGGGCGERCGKGCARVHPGGLPGVRTGDGHPLTARPIATCLGRSAHRMTGLRP